MPDRALDIACVVKSLFERQDFDVKDYGEQGPSVQAILNVREGNVTIVPRHPVDMPNVDHVAVAFSATLEVA